MKGDGGPAGPRLQTREGNCEESAEWSGNRTKKEKDRGLVLGREGAHTSSFRATGLGLERSFERTILPFTNHGAD